MRSFLVDLSIRPLVFWRGVIKTIVGHSGEKLFQVDLQIVILRFHSRGL